jgi:hypothetical protein
VPEPAPTPDTHDNTTAAVGARAGDVVYTALFGRYEALIEEECALDSDAEFICFTDDPSLTSKTWRVELVEPRFPMDPIRSARWVKVFGDDSIWQEFDRSLWVDNRVSLKADPTEILDSLLEEPQADMALFEHSFRHRVIDEFDAVVEGRFDDPDRVYEQLIHYAEASPDVLDEQPLWTGFIARRHNEQVASAMHTWAAHICRYSRRDQLSVNLALQEAGLCVTRMARDNRESEWHVWPPLSDTLGRQHNTRVRAFEHSIRAPLARLRSIEREHHDLLEAHAVSAAKRDKVVATEKHRADNLENLLAEEKRRRLEADLALAASHERIARLSERVEQLRSRTVVLRKRLEQRQRRIVTLKKQVDRLQRRMAALDERAGKQAAARPRPTSTDATTVVRAGKRLAARARARLHG